MKVEVVAGESFTGKPARQLANIMVTQLLFITVIWL